MLMPMRACSRREVDDAHVRAVLSREGRSEPHLPGESSVVAPFERSLICRCDLHPVPSTRRSAFRRDQRRPPRALLNARWAGAPFLKHESVSAERNTTRSPGVRSLACPARPIHRGGRGGRGPPLHGIAVQRHWSAAREMLRMKSDVAIAAGRPMSVMSAERTGMFYASSNTSPAPPSTPSVAG